MAISLLVATAAVLVAPCFGNLPARPATSGSDWPVATPSSVGLRKSDLDDALHFINKQVRALQLDFLKQSLHFWGSAGFSRVSSRSLKLYAVRGLRISDSLSSWRLQTNHMDNLSLEGGQEPCRLRFLTRRY